MTQDVNHDVKVLGREVRVIVPGTWVSIPLDSPEKAGAFIKRLVRDQVGPADRLARMRRQAVEEVFGTARDAAQIGVHTYLMSLELAPGVPFPAALLMADDEWPASTRTLVEAGDLEGALKLAYPEGEVAVQSNGSPAARIVEMTQGQAGDGEEAVEVLTMRLEYHMPHPADPSKMLFVRVNVPDIPSAEPFAMLFDEIVDSIMFLDDRDSPTGVVPEAAATASATA
ncbi:hypothetical protein ACFT2C_16620 [Promicromonospora sp. NPDC057138]|uniref:hypothetical protein n=1 Tax=Promicromonospora sp. NPDC057138 TaxID=3346031 RepID=UPI003631FDA7